MKYIYVVVDSNDKVFEDTISYNEEECIRKWVMSWLVTCKNIDKYDAGNIFRIFQKNGYNTKEIELPEEV